MGAKATYFLILFCSFFVKVSCLYRLFVLCTNRTDECAAKRTFGYSTFLFIAVTYVVLSFQGLRLIRFSLAGFNNFLTSYRFILVVVLLHKLIFPQYKNVLVAFVSLI